MEFMPNGVEEDDELGLESIYCVCRVPELPNSNWIECSACKDGTTPIPVSKLLVALCKTYVAEHNTSILCTCPQVSLHFTLATIKTVSCQEKCRKRARLTSAYIRVYKNSVTTFLLFRIIER